MKAFEGGYEYPDGYTVGNEDWHFAKRLFDRYGITLQYGEISAIKRGLSRAPISRARKGRHMRHVEWKRREPNGTIGSYELNIVVPNGSRNFVSALPRTSARRWELF